MLDIAQNDVVVTVEGDNLMLILPNGAVIVLEGYVGLVIEGEPNNAPEMKFAGGEIVDSINSLLDQLEFSRETAVGDDQKPGSGDEEVAVLSGASRLKETLSATESSVTLIDERDATIVGSSKKDSGRNSASTKKPTETERVTVVDSAAPEAPSDLALSSADDTGSSNSDGITKTTDSLTITGKAEAGSTVELFDGTKSLGTVIAGGNGDFSKDVNLAASASAHSITAKATDAAGNTSAASEAIDITLDTAAPGQPGIEVVSSENKLVNKDEDGINLEVKATGMVAGDEIQLKLGGADLGSACSVTAADITAGKATIKVAKADLGADGDKSITATVTDAAGNASAASDATDIKLGITAPSLTEIIDPQTTIFTGKNGQLAVQLKFNEEMALADGKSAEITLIIDKTDGTQVEIAARVRHSLSLSDSSVGNVFAGTVWEVLTSQEVGQLTFSGDFNPFGNTSMVDTSKAVYRMTDVNGDVWYAWARQDSGYHITKAGIDGAPTGEWYWELSTSSTGFASSPDEVGVWMRSSGAAGTPAMTMLPSGLAFSEVAGSETVTFTTDKLTEDGLFDRNGISVKANSLAFDQGGLTDLAGNEVSKTIGTKLLKNHQVDTLAPVMAPTVDSLIGSDTTPVITGMVGDSALATGEALTVTVNGATYENVSVDGDGRWRVDTGSATPKAGTTLGSFIDGTSYEVTAVVRDVAGNNSSDGSATEITIDTTGPISGDVGSNRLAGTNVNEILTGGGGKDTFVYNGDDGDDTITDFSATDDTEGDVLDLRDLLVGYDSNSNLSDFLQVTKSANDTVIRIDSNGTTGGSSYNDISITLQGVDTTLADLETNNNLLVM
ncbi:Ig-like domain-containing protein [Candidatus Vondammii sp. HM_W22]|uniref:Ig-like domain-containing protein n=1 Tax=Candidatus Vondammii sp. HM_W22 TaxID=2687299 RepID=UPI002E7B5BEF|nr:Ig-like domain-containing protein [Candidatus Vondammii sp. HM_W22]